MELKEVQVYRERLEKEYQELLSYRQLILRQIEIDKQELREDGKIKRIAELEAELAILKEKKISENKKDILNEIKEIKTYRDRLKQEYGEVLSYRPILLNQQEIDEKETINAGKKREVILYQIAQDIIQANKEVQEVKKQKENFVKELDEKENRIKAKSQEIDEKERDVLGRLEENRLLMAKYDSALGMVEEERKELKKNNQLTKESKEDLDKKEFEYKEKLGEVEQGKKSLDKDLTLIQRKKEKIAQEEGFLLLRDEAIRKTIEQLDKREKEIEDNRKHLESQQAQLTTAFEEARRKKII